MVRNRIISAILFSLVLLVNWHNTFIHVHDHHGGEQNAVRYEHKHDHPDGHHHDLGAFSLADLIDLIFGDFGHPDLGQDHLELLPNPNSRIGAISLVLMDHSLFVHPRLFTQAMIVEHERESTAPDRFCSFSDPPYIESNSNRGPPAFS